MLKRCLALLGFTAVYIGPSFAQSQDAPDLTHFPYPVVEVSGDKALAEWQALRDAADGTPIIIGSTEDVALLTEAFHPEYGFGDTDEVALTKARELEHPQSLIDLRMQEREAMLSWAKDRGNTQMIGLFSKPYERDENLAGDWPSRAEVNPGLLSLTDYMTGKIYDRVYITVLPTDDPSEAPAYLRLGGWNAHPPPEYHVAAFRNWYDRFGAVPVLITHEVIEFRVDRRPESRTAALELAWEQYDYCEDIVLQGVGSVSALAASLEASDWWYFWWD